MAAWDAGSPDQCAIATSGVDHGFFDRAGRVTAVATDDRGVGTRGAFVGGGKD